jgi:hypothetical protein
MSAHESADTEMHDADARAFAIVRRPPYVGRELRQRLLAQSLDGSAG